VPRCFVLSYRHTRIDGSAACGRNCSVVASVPPIVLAPLHSLTEATHGHFRLTKTSCPQHRAYHPVRESHSESHVPKFRRASSRILFLSRQIVHLEGQSAKGAPIRQDVANCFQGKLQLTPPPSPASRPSIEGCESVCDAIGNFKKLISTAEHLRAAGYVADA
jgi:hypothetical protein